ncbi:hypothetical protein IW262DRAFT_1553304 [Armillaria fumosa]|nr:hypothetical protein IW262DRAFT_1553304 [Armillaria fumosa]
MALMKLGLTALLLLVNNSAPAFAHLTRLTDATHLIYGAKFVQEAHDTQELLRNQGYKVELVEDRHFPLWGPEGVKSTKIKSFPATLTPEQESKRPAIILHSSGSTGFPKPVRITHYGLIANVALNQNKPGFSTLPVFHGYGHFAASILMQVPWSTADALPACLSHPVLFPFNTVLIKLLLRTVIAAPRGNTSRHQCSGQFPIVRYAGAPLSDDLNDRLVEARVNLLSIYGTTETGSLMNCNRDFATDKLWNWTCPLLGSANYLVWEPQGGDTFEVIVKDRYPPKTETNRWGGSYATKDLFLQPPERKDLYKYIGMLDDALVHIWREDQPHAHGTLHPRKQFMSIVFGAGKPQTGCLILPSGLAHEEDLSQEDLMSKFWPVIGQANAAAPTHSRLLPEMVEFLPYMSLCHFARPVYVR